MWVVVVGTVGLVKEPSLTLPPSAVVSAGVVCSRPGRRGGQAAWTIALVTGGRREASGMDRVVAKC